MSDENETPAAGDTQTLDGLRRQAKQLLKQAHAGDPVLLERLRVLLPRMASLSDAAIVETIKLADVQHAIARKSGHESWGALKGTLESIDPVHVQAGRFLAALQEHEIEKAKSILDAHPAVARYSIHTAAAVNDAATVESLLAEDPTQAAKPFGSHATEPIIYASHAGVPDALDVPESERIRTVELLLNAGASANAYVKLNGSDDARIPVLYFACVSNNVTVVKLLLERGANPNDGESVYHAAEHNHRECLELLKTHGANLSGSHEYWGNTPLYFLAAYTESNRLHAASVQGMRWLLEHGADPNVASTFRSDDSNNVAHQGETPLHRIAEYGRSVQDASMLIDHGAQVDLPRADGRTPYALAVRVGNTAVAEYLASLGAVTTQLSEVDRLLGAIAVADEAVARSLAANNTDLVPSLTRADRMAIQGAIFSNREASVRLMLELGWPLTDEGEWGGTPLHWAAWSGRPNLVRMLLEHGAAVNVRDSQYGSSPIAWASHGSTNSRPDNDADYLDVVQQLLAAGSTRAESYNKWNEPPESMASPAVAQALRESGFTK